MNACASSAYVYASLLQRRFILPVVKEAFSRKVFIALFICASSFSRTIDVNFLQLASRERMNEVYKVDDTVPISSSLFIPLHSQRAILFRDRAAAAQRREYFKFTISRKWDKRRCGFTDRKKKAMYRIWGGFLFHVHRSTVNYNERVTAIAVPSFRACYNRFISRLRATWRNLGEEKMIGIYDWREMGKTNTVSFVRRKKRRQDFFAFSIARSDGSAVSYRHCSAKPADTMAGCVPFY